MADFDQTDVGFDTSPVSGNGHSSNGNSSGTTVHLAQLYVAPMPYSVRGKSVQLTGLLGWLSRVLQMNIYGDSLLSATAASEMKLYALMLAIITLFDFLAWAFLWNLIFYNRAWQVGLLSPLALLLGMMFASMVFFYERSWITRDISYGVFSKQTGTTLLGLLFRIVMIGVAAYIQAQPIEFITFNSAIQKRIHEESVRGEALNRLRLLEDADRKTRGADAFKGTVEREESDKAESALEQSRKDDAVLKLRMDNARKAVENAQQRLNYARNLRDSEGRQYPELISRRQNELNTANQNYDIAQKEYQGNSGKIQGALEDRDRKVNVLVEKQGNAEQEVARIRNWIAQIRNQKKIDPDVEVTEVTKEGITPWTFKDEDYDFFDRMGLITDLRRGTPPRWLNASPEDQAKIREKFGFSDTEEDRIQRINQSATYSQWWWGILGASIFIPAMVFIVKLFMRPELKKYYSRREQQLAFNYDAY